MHKAKFIEVNPVLPVKDVKEAIEYYVEKFGFKLIFVDNKENLSYAGVKRDNVELHLQWHDPAEFENVEKLNLRFIIEDIEGLHEEYMVKGFFIHKLYLGKHPGKQGSLPFSIHTTMG